MVQDASNATGASNVLYDLVSIQYHALKGAQVYDQYLQDAQSSGHDEIVQFIRRVQEQDRERAEQAHQLLGLLQQAGEANLG